MMVEVWYDGIRDQRVTVDGTDISQIVQYAHLEMQAGQMAKLELTLVPEHVIVHADLPRPAIEAWARLIDYGQLTLPLERA